jgi:hypothetical protein
MIRTDNCVELITSGKKSVNKTFLLSLAAINFLLNSPAFAAVESIKMANGTEPTLASQDNGKLDIAFLNAETNAKVRDVFFSSSETGKVWANPLNISQSPGNCSHPNLAVERSGAIDVVWTGSKAEAKGQDIFLVRSEDGGKNWSEPQNISRTRSAGESALAVGADDSIHVVWQDLTADTHPSDIFYVCSTDKGRSWSKPENVSNTPKHSSQPVIAIDGNGLVNVSWLDSRSGEQRPDIFFERRIEGAWTSPLNVSDSQRLSAHPTLACGPKGTVYLAWSDNSRKEKSPDIWCAVGNKKNHFAKPINISNTPGVSSQPAIAADSRGRVAVVWSDTTPGVPDIFGRISNDRADDFTTVLDLPHTVGGSTRPCVTICGDIAFVAWQENNGERNVIKLAQIPIKTIATGPIQLVDPVLHPSGVSRNH